jgi:hypothetical protein
MAVAAGGAGLYASGGHGRTLVVTMTNDPTATQIRIVAPRAGDRD